MKILLEMDRMDLKDIPKYRGHHPYSSFTMAKKSIFEKFHLRVFQLSTGPFESFP